MNDVFRYAGCGLDNVFLRNGYTFTQLSSGEEVIHITDVMGLHRALAQAIVDGPAELDAQTFKFLRKEQDKSQRQLASILGVEEQTVSLWERARTPIPKYADLVLRTLAKERCSNNAELNAMVDRLNSLDRDRHMHEMRIEMALDEEWQATA